MAPPKASAGLPEPLALASVAAFHELFKAPVVEGGPKMPPGERCELRVSLLQEELNELKTAIAQHDLVESADALADLQYVLSGAVLEFGLHRRFKAIFDEVQRSNLSKACSTQEEAELTVAHYKAKGFDSEIRESKFAPDKLLVKRLPDTKLLKSVAYSPAALKPIVEAEEEGLAPAIASAGLPEPASLTSVAAFHEMFESPIVEGGPKLPGPDRCELRVSLLQEELNELKAAIAANDLVECADALADLQYVLSGAVLEFGLHRCFKAIFDEVQRSNMSKACATRSEAEDTAAHYKKKQGVESEIQEVSGQFLVYRLPDKKVLKSVKYSPAQLKPIVEAPEAEPMATEQLEAEPSAAELERSTQTRRPTPEETLESPEKSMAKKPCHRDPAAAEAEADSKAALATALGHVAPDQEVTSA